MKQELVNNEYVVENKHAMQDSSYLEQICWRNLIVDIECLFCFFWLPFFSLFEKWNKRGRDWSIQIEKKKVKSFYFSSPIKQEQSNFTTTTQRITKESPTSNQPSQAILQLSFWKKQRIPICFSSRFLQPDYVVLALFHSFNLLFCIFLSLFWISNCKGCLDWKNFWIFIKFEKENGVFLFYFFLIRFEMFFCVPSSTITITITITL